MQKILGVLITVVLTSFYYFPFHPWFIPVANTKMIMAAFGLVILGFNLAKRGQSLISRDFFVLSLIAAVVSIICIVAVIYNNTYDYTYATYFISMWVWMGGAYVVINLIRWVHGYSSIELVIHYLIAVCVGQCLLAYTMGQYQPLKDFVDSILVGSGFMGKADNRLYGLGASLDVAGLRFSGVLVSIAYLILNLEKTLSRMQMFFYVISFIIIAVIGNMISRSTTIGIGVALLYLICVIFTNSASKKGNLANLMMVGVPLLFSIILILTVGYRYNDYVHSNLRFAFEGFFSLWEEGRWDVQSNNILKDMIVFPDNMKTWIIGDGYFQGPYDTDPYYIGETWKVGYYMGTDIGYLRFIFYFGLAGMLTFAFFMWRAAKACIDRFPNMRNLFILVLLINYIIWFKVSSDLFSLLALFLCVSLRTQESQGEIYN